MNDPLLIKSLSLYTFFFLCFQSGIFANNDDMGTTGYPEYDEEAVIARINNLSNEVVPPRYDEIVRSYIITYTERRREAAQHILGRSVMYFPMFEDYLKKRNLPTDLKYLAVVESALDPKAVSRAGAVGLWQFMPPTARWLGMEINNDVDERRDPHKSTLYALNYLNILYNRFGDWELAIAAYNGGGGRVSRAMKRARSKDFWTIRRYLPKETRNYVPAFIAAYYLFHHYESHDLVPEYPDLDLQLTKTIKIYDQYSFYEIAQITGLPLDIIEALNPSYPQMVIPEHTEGHYLTLPSRVMTVFEEFLNSKNPDPNNPRPIISAPVFVTRPGGSSADYVKSAYIVREGDTIEKLAQEANCTVHQLKAWNNLKSNTLTPGRQLIVFYPKDFNPSWKLKQYGELIPITTMIPRPVEALAPIWVREQKSFVTKGGYLYYQLKRKESVLELADKIPDVSVRDLMQLNGFKTPLDLIKANSYVRLRKL